MGRRCYQAVHNTALSDSDARKREQEFKFMGRFLGKLLFDDFPVDAHLSVLMFKALVGTPVEENDLSQIDHQAGPPGTRHATLSRDPQHPMRCPSHTMCARQMYQSLAKIKDMDCEVCELGYMVDDAPADAPPVLRRVLYAGVWHLFLSLGASG